jgi:predicted PurR-regulated permease PerM
MARAPARHHRSRVDRAESTPTPSPSSAERRARRFFTVLVVGTLAMLALVIRPLASALFLAAVLAGFLWPIYRRLVVRLGGRRSLVAAVFAVGVVVLLVGPVATFSTFVVKEALESLQLVSKMVRSEGVDGMLMHLPDPIERLARQVLERLPQEPGGGLDETVQKQVSAQGGKAVAAVRAAVSATGSLLFHGAMMVVAFFFLLVQGAELVAWLDRISPLRPGQTREILTEVKKVTYAVIVSTVITAGVQALTALVGYFIARVPHPLFFAGVTFFVAFIPAVGAASVCLAAAGLLLLMGHPYYALFLAIWAVAVVGLVDNVVKPYLIKAGMELKGAVVFFALIGGVGAFGALGLLIGPLVVSLFLALIRIYDRDFKLPA